MNTPFRSSSSEHFVTLIPGENLVTLMPSEITLPHILLHDSRILLRVFQMKVFLTAFELNGSTLLASAMIKKREMDLFPLVASYMIRVDMFE